MKRRSFIENSSKVVAALTVAPLNSMANNTQEKTKRKVRVVLVGTGMRGSATWGKNLVDGFGEWVEMVGLCDINSKRVEYAKKYIGADSAKTYSAKDFDLMIKETKPDTVIVTTTDSFHVDYIVRAMELGVDVISEKPLAINVEQCQRILDTEYKTGKKVTVGFNMRFMNMSPEIKRVLDSGELGKIISVDFQEYLDVDHGSSYFRRWHGKSKYSGSLLVHKASHHFDLINWYLDADPIEVQAMGKVAFYGKNNSFRGKNCRNCAFTDKCDFFWDVKKYPQWVNLYVNCEDVDGYYRDGCVWDNDNDSFDVSTTQVVYDNGTILTYTQNTNLPYEGQYISFTGEKGRMDVRLYSRQPWEVEAPIEIRVSKGLNNTKVYTIKNSKGNHGGADAKVKDLIFNPNKRDNLRQKAGSRAGVLASLIGIAAKQSIETGKRVNIEEMIKFPTTWQG